MTQHGMREEFQARFGRAPEVAARAPGRVNLIGEHTDYNAGLVLPCAIDRVTRVWGAARRDGRLRVFSRELGPAPELSVASLARGHGFADYVAGVVWALAEAGHPIPGADLAIASDVPAGSGLSSSAALGVGVAAALGALFELPLDAAAWARIAHRGESGFVGVPCGVMDQFASALGRRGAALRIDCRSLEVTPVPIAGAELRLLVAHSGVRRELRRGGYGDRREECRAALAEARRGGVAPQARALRDLAASDLPALARALPDALFRRARHVILENSRVDAVCAALRAGDVAAAGARLREGQASLRDDFEVSVPELDALCEIADALPGVHGSRLTGAGFGGCTLHLVDAGAAEAAAAGIAAGFERRFGRRPPLWAVAPSDGASARRLDA
jgi:galactokinase